MPPSLPHSELFTRQVREQTTRLFIAERTFFDWLFVERLEIETPSDPTVNHSDVKNQRGTVKLACFQLDQRRLSRFIRRARNSSWPSHFENLSVRLGNGYIGVSCRVVSQPFARLYFRLHLRCDGLLVYGVVGDAFVWGHSPTPALVLADQVLTALTCATTQAPQETQHSFYATKKASVWRGLGQVEIRPLLQFLWATLPAKGWKLPDPTKVSPLALRVSTTSLTLSYGANQPPRRPTSLSLSQEDSSRLFEETALLYSCDELLHKQSIREAIHSYQQELLRREKNHADSRFVVKRLLGIAATGTAQFPNAKKFASQMRARQTTVAADIALSSLAMLEGKTKRAMNLIRGIAEEALQQGDDELALEAALAGGEMARTALPEIAVELFELALRILPGHDDASLALSTIYHHQKKSDQLTRVLRGRAKRSTDQMEKLDLQIQLATILRQDYQDPEQAIRELRKAESLVPHFPPVHTALAQAYLDLGDNDAAWDSITQALHEQTTNKDDTSLAFSSSQEMSHPNSDPNSQPSDAPPPKGHSSELPNSKTLPHYTNHDFDSLYLAYQIATNRQDTSAVHRFQERLLTSEIPTDEVRLRAILGVAQTKSLWKPALAFAHTLVELTHLEGDKLLLAQIELKAGNSEAAIERATSLVHSPDPTIAAEAHRLLANIGQQKNDLPRAIYELGQAVSTLQTAAKNEDATTNALPTSSVLLSAASQLAIEQAKLYRSMGNANAAGNTLAKAHAMTKDTDPPQARRAATQILQWEQDHGNTESQRVWIDAILMTKPPVEQKCDLLLRRAEIHNTKGATSACLRDIATVIDIAERTDPRQSTELRSLIDKAQGLRTKVLDNQPEQHKDDHTQRTSWEYLQQARSYFSAGRRGAASQSATIALTMAREQRDPSPIAPEALCILSACAATNRDWLEVLRIHRQLTSDYNMTLDSADYQYRLAIAYTETEDPTAAQKILIALLGLGTEDTVQSSPNNQDIDENILYDAWQLLADVVPPTTPSAPSSNSKDSSQEDILLAFAHDTRLTAAQQAHGWHRYGECMRQSNPAVAENAFCSALEYYPGYLPSLNALEDLYRQQGNIVAAMQVVQTKIEWSQGAPHRQKQLLVQLAALQLQQGQRERARGTYTKALLLDPTLGEALEFIAADSLAVGDIEQAFSAYCKLATALAKDESSPNKAIPTTDEIKHSDALSYNVSKDQSEDEPLSFATQRRKMALEETKKIALEHPQSYALAAKDVFISVLQDPTAEPLYSFVRTLLAQVTNQLTKAPPRTTETPQATRALENANKAIDNRDLAKAAKILDTALGQMENSLPLLAARADVAAQSGQYESQVLWLLALADAVLKNQPEGEKAASVRAATIYKQLATIYLQQWEDSTRAMTMLRSAANLFRPGDQRDQALREVAQLAKDTDQTDEWTNALETLLQPSDDDRLSLAHSYLYAGDEVRAMQILTMCDKDHLPSQNTYQSLLPTVAGDTAVSLPQQKDSVPVVVPVPMPTHTSGVIHQIQSPSDTLKMVASTSHFELLCQEQNFQQVIMEVGQNAETIPDDFPWDTLHTYFVDADSATHVDFLRLRIQATKNQQQRLLLWLQLGTLLQQMDGKHEDAYLAFRQAHNQSPKNTQSAHALRPYAIARGEWSFAIALLETILSEATTPSEIGGLRLEQAMICDQKIGDTVQAIEFYQMALTADPSIPAAPLPLARLYQKMKRYEEAVQICQQAADRTPIAERKSKLFQLAAVCSEQLGNPGAAVRFYQLVRTHTPLAHERAVATAAINRLTTESHSMVTTSDATSGRKPRYDDTLELRLHEATTTEARTAILQKLLSQTLEETKRCDYAKQLLDIDRSDPVAFAVLRNYYQSTKDAPALIRVVHDYVTGIPYPDEKANHLASLGCWLKDVAKDIANATDSFRRAKAYSANNLTAVSRLAHIAYSQYDWAQAKELYSQLAPADYEIGPPAVFFRLGEVAEALDNDTDALAQYRQSYRLQSQDNPLALRGIARISQRLGDLPAAIEATQALLHEIPAESTQETARFRQSLAELLQKDNQIQDAIREHERVLQDYPKSFRSWEALVNLYIQTGAFSRASFAQQRLVELIDPPKRKCIALYRLATIYEVYQQDYEHAADALLKAADLDPTNIPTLRKLVDHYWISADSAALLQVARDLATEDALLDEQTPPLALCRILMTAYWSREDGAVTQIRDWLGPNLALRLANFLAHEVNTQIKDASHLVTSAIELVKDKETLRIAIQAVYDTQVDAKTAAGNTLPKDFVLEDSRETTLAKIIEIIHLY